MYYKSAGYRLFNLFNCTLLGVIALLCIFPMIHILALSFSSGSAASANMVTFWPVQFTTEAYAKTFENALFLRSIGNSGVRLVLGVVLGMLVTILTAYPLSKMDARAVRGRQWFTWYFVFPMLFNGGLIPFYIVLKNLNLINSMWVLILPTLISTWNIILLMNFFRGIPKELEEASLIDGAGQFRTLFLIFVPVSMPSIATLSLFQAVWHWNSWFDGMIFLSDQQKWPLSTLLQSILVVPDPTQFSSVDPNAMKSFSERTVKAAQIFVGSFPVLAVYPFLQKYFVKGITVGAVKE